MVSRVGHGVHRFAGSNSTSDLDGQTVESRFHSGWKRVKQFLMPDLMGHVREKGPFGPNGPRCLDRLLHVEVGGVRVPPPKGVEDEDFDPLQGLHGPGWKGLGVGDIPEGPDPEPENRCRSVGHGQRKKLPAQNIQGLEGMEPVETELRNGAPRLRVNGLIEDIGEPPQEFVMGPFRTEDRHVLLGPEPEDPQVIGPMDMIGMQMREPDRVDMVDSGRHQLKAQLGWGIDHEVSLGKSDHRPVPCPAVPGIIGCAPWTMATDDRHSEGGSGP